MKRLGLILGVVLMAQLSFGQIFTWGLKGGVNSSKIKFDDFKVNDASVSIKPDYLPGGSKETELWQDYNNDGVKNEINPMALDLSARVTFQPSSYELGYHFGAFARLKLLGVFIQPELIFSQTNTSINIKQGDEFKSGSTLISDITATTANIRYTNFDIPVLVGFKFGPARICAGPVATFKLGTKSDVSAGQEVGEMIDDYTKVTEKATFGGQAGIGIDILKKVTIDLRYEFPLSKLGDKVTINGSEFKTDQRQSQFLASIGFMF